MPLFLKWALFYIKPKGKNKIKPEGLPPQLSKVFLGKDEQFIGAKQKLRNLPQKKISEERRGFYPMVQLVVFDGTLVAPTHMHKRKHIHTCTHTSITNGATQNKGTKIGDVMHDDMMHIR